ncbi:hypothetical protein PTKIN_Ptkin15bG0067700 [Pterospermum kingtungense]
MEHEDPRNGESTHRSSKKPKISSKFISESEIRVEFSHHHPRVARINNGSFGSCPGLVLEAQRQWQLQFLRQPDAFYFNTLRNGIMASRKIIKDLINADHIDEVSLVDNATTAAAIVLQQIGRCFAEGKFQKNDTVLMLHCAFQAVKKSIQAYVTRAGGFVIEYGNGLPTESAWIGTRDYSSQLVVPAVLEFVNRFEGGIDGIMKRNHDQVVKMGKMLAESWGTNLGSPLEMCAAMIMVGLPSRLSLNSEEDAVRLRSHLRGCYDVEVPIFYQVSKHLKEGVRDKDGFITGYVRISHQVYNTLEDYEKLRDAINRLVEDGKTCKMLQIE